MPTKHVHRIPITEEFIEPIGESVCVCQYLDDSLHCIGRRLRATFYGQIEGKTSGILTNKLKNLVKEANIDCSLRVELLELCDEAIEVFQKRNKVVHSKGYTTNEGTQSRVYRRSSRTSYEYLDPHQIREFTKEAAAVACKANSLLHDSRMPNE